MHGCDFTPIAALKFLGFLWSFLAMVQDLHAESALSSRYRDAVLFEQGASGGKRPTTAQKPRRMQPLNDKSIYTPKWSPDGKHFLYQLRQGGKWSLHIVGVDGQNNRRIVEMEGREPSWSPDGGHILFQSKKFGNWDLYVMERAGSKTRRLTSDPAADRYGSWSPDGRTIAFLSGRTGTDQIYLLNVATGKVNPTANVLAKDNWFRMSWSPDSRQIAFTGRLKSDKFEQSEGNLIYIMDVRTFELRPLTKKPAFFGNIDWSPDGAWLAFDGPSHGRNDSSGGQWEIFEIRADGSDLRQVTDSTYNIWGPDHSPDGRKLAVAHGFDDQYEIYVLDRQSGKLERVTHEVYPNRH